VKAELRRIHSPDAPDGLGNWRPRLPRDFALLLEAEIGPKGGDGAEVFSVRVVGTDWFGARPPGRGFRWGRGILVLDEWDLDAAEQAIRDLCDRFEGDTWAEVAARLAGFMDWEFEGYRP